MISEKRRAPRAAIEMPITLVLRDEGDEAALVDPVPGFLKDVSSYGAGLVISKVYVGSNHLFYTPHDHPEMVLSMEIIQDEETVLDIPVYPIWFNSDQEDEANPFRMGVEFMLDSESPQMKAFNTLLRKKRKGGGWWNAFSLKKD